MPIKTETVEPELVLDYKGVRVWRSYVNDDIDFPEEFLFTTGKNDTNSSSFAAFSVREAVVAQQPKRVFAPLGTDLVQFQQTAAYIEARILWDNWFAFGQPTAIRVELRRAIDINNLK